MRLRVMYRNDLLGIVYLTVGLIPLMSIGLFPFSVLIGVAVVKNYHEVVEKLDVIPGSLPMVARSLA